MLRHGATYGLGTLANRLAGFVLLPFYTREIPAAELGALFVLVATGGFLTTFLGLGMSSAIFRFHYRNEEARERDRVIASAFVAVVGAATLVLALLWIARGPICRLLLGDDSLTHLYGAMLAGVFFDVALFVPLGLLRVQERSGRYTLLSVLRFLITITLAVWLVVGREMGAYGVLIATAVTSALVFVVAGRGVLQRLGAGVSRPLTRGLLRFGVPIMLATIGGVLVDSSDLWLLRAFAGAEEVSHYGAIYRIAKILHVIVIQPFILVWPAVMWSVAERPEGHAVYKRTLTYAVATIACAALGVSLFRGELISIIATPAFLDAAWVLPWIAFGFVFLLSTYVLNSGITLSGRTEFITWTMVITVAVNVGLNLWLIPEHGMRGAAVATFAAYAVMAVAMTGFGQRLHPIAYDWRRLGTLVVLSGGLVAVGLPLENVDGLAGILLRLLVLAAFPAVVLSPFFMSGAERRGLLDVLERARAGRR